MEAKTQLFLNKQVTLFHWLEKAAEALGIEPVKAKEDYKFDMFDDLTTGVIFLKIFKAVSGKEVNFIPSPKSTADKLINLTEVQSLADTELGIGVFSELDIGQYLNFSSYKKLLPDYYDIGEHMSKKYSDALPPMGNMERAPQTNKYGGQIFPSDTSDRDAYYANSARLLVSLRMAIRDLALKADPWSGIAQLLGKEEVAGQMVSEYERPPSQNVVPPQLASLCNKTIVLKDENNLLESLARTLIKKTGENNQYINEHVDSDSSKMFETKSSTFGKIYRENQRLTDKGTPTTPAGKSTKTTQSAGKQGSSGASSKPQYDCTVYLCKGLKKANEEQAEAIERKTALASMLGNETEVPSTSQSLRSTGQKHQTFIATQNEMADETEPVAVLPEINHNPEVLATNSAYQVQLDKIKTKINDSNYKLTKLKEKNVQQAANYTKLSKSVKDIDEKLKEADDEFKKLTDEFKKLRQRYSTAISDYKGTDLSKIDITKGRSSKNEKDMNSLIVKEREQIGILNSQLRELEDELQENLIRLESLRPTEGTTEPDEEKIKDRRSESPAQNENAPQQECKEQEEFQINADIEQPPNGVPEIEPVQTNQEPAQEKNTDPENQAPEGDAVEGEQNNEEHIDIPAKDEQKEEVPAQVSEKGPTSGETENTETPLTNLGGDEAAEANPLLEAAPEATQ